MRTLTSPGTLMQRACGRSCIAVILMLLMNTVAEVTAQQFTYVVTNGAISITGGCQPGNAEVPNQINGVAVTSIGNSAFGGCSLLTGASLPEGLFRACPKRAVF